MAERTIQAEGIELWTEDFGDPANPAVLLIMGAESQGTMWPIPLIEQLTGGGRYVVRYDNRDVGQSDWFDFQEQPYTLNDMARDALGVLDAYAIDRAHVVGASMGGMIAQILMIEAPERLHSATIVMSSPLSGKPDEQGMPQLFDETLPRGPILDTMSEFIVTEPPASKEDYVSKRVEMFAALTDPSVLDRDLLRQMFELEFDRARNIVAKNNHSLAMGATEPWDRRPALAHCQTPTTVIHGENDPILPLPHGQAIAEAVLGSRMETLAGMAHDLPEHSWPVIVDAVG